MLSKLDNPVPPKPPLSAADQDDSAPLPRVATITTKAARRAVKQGGLALLVLVTEAQPPPSPDTDPKLAQLQHEFSDIFKSELPGLPPYRGVEIEAVKLSDDNIRCRPMPRYSHKEKECIKQELTKLIAKGLVRPSSSPVRQPTLCCLSKERRYSSHGTVFSFSSF